MKHDVQTGAAGEHIDFQDEFINAVALFIHANDRIHIWTSVRPQGVRR